jgi:hypothetical protein
MIRRLLVPDWPLPRRVRRVAGEPSIGFATELVRDDAHLLECFTKRLRHLDKCSLTVRWAGVTSQVEQIRRAEFRVAQPLVDHFGRDVVGLLIQLPLTMVCHADG